MEPASLDSTAAGGSPGRTGSLENPELIEDVPGHVIPILQREFDDFDTEPGGKRGLFHHPGSQRQPRRFAFAHANG